MSARLVPSWTCDLHNVTTTGDCPRCDDELIAATDTAATPAAECCACGRVLNVGDPAWAADWRVLDVSGERARWRHETRYTCDECHEKESR